MERKSIWMLFCIIGLYLFAPRQAYAHLQSALEKGQRNGFDPLR